MTCIAGIARNDKVWIGGDSAGIAGWRMTVRADEKVFVSGEFAYGFTSSFRMGDLLRFSFSPPEQTSHQTDDRGYLATTWTDALRECLGTGGLKKIESGVEKGGQFLLGYKGRLYSVDWDFQIALAVADYDAVGAGCETALGALYAMRDSKLTPEVQIKAALAAAEEHNASVRAPFRVVMI